MDHSAMDMGSATATATTASAAASSTAAAMSMGGESSCKISMLWNWYTIDACFISRSWHITSKGMFAGSCIGVILLVISLEALRRGAREFDRYIVRQAQLRNQADCRLNPDSSSDNNNGATAVSSNCVASTMTFRPDVWQQLIRAAFHCAQFTVAYFIMLLAMYYNGYIIISIIIGAFLGSFVCSWEAIGLASDDKREATMCCG